METGLNSENMNSNTGAVSVTFMCLPVTSAMSTNESSPFCEQKGVATCKTDLCLLVGVGGSTTGQRDKIILILFSCFQLRKAISP